jgi:hypothetical protein
MRRPWPMRAVESFKENSGYYNGTGKGFNSCQYGQMKTGRFREERIYAICF